MDLLRKDAPIVARQLIGYELLVIEDDGSTTGGIITETEAYTAEDAASHSHKGKTKRNSVMFGEAGVIYVYFTYGMHWCMNIVTGDTGGGEAVLIRAISPTKNLKLMNQRRNNIEDSLLTNGPAKLCQALGITGRDNGLKINDHKQPRFILKRPVDTKSYNIESTKRIGIKKDTHRLWRFVAVN